VRVTVQLVEAPTNENHWADGYTRAARRILAVESEIASLVATAVHAVITTDAPALPAPDFAHDTDGGITDPAALER
jgi:hypothetical protein